jgi:hypothetical protein
MFETIHIKILTSKSRSNRFRIWEFGNWNLFRISKLAFRIFLISMFIGISSSRSQDVQVTAKVDSNHVRIGDWFRLTVDVQHPKDVPVTFPALPDTFEGFEIVKREQPVTKQNDQLAMESLTFTMTSFDSGTHFIPSIPIQFTRKGDTTKYFAKTSPIPITVGGIAVDTTQDIRDVKPPMSVPITFADVLPYLLVAVGIAGAFWLVRYIVRKRKKGEPLIPEAPPRPADEMALEALHALESEKLWQREKVKEYHSQLTDIVRTYIERRFKILAMESTSDEILSGFTDGMIEKNLKEDLKTVLFRADLVKFAKAKPIAQENEESLTLSYKFVQTTSQPIPAQSSAPVQESTNA